MAVVHLRRPSIALLECSSCGATADASCNCGAPYVPARERAAAAVAANPEKSDRAIAADIGVSHPTVAKARKTTGNNLPVDGRVGMDGKVRKLPDQRARANRGRRDAHHDKIIEENHYNIFLNNCHAVAALAVYEGRVDAKAMKACRRAVQAWSDLLKQLEVRYAEETKA
jgi:hypothetical protein